MSSFRACADGSTKRTCQERYKQINDFERMLSMNGVVILKFMLHISRDEQKRRLLDRLTDESKNWKFRAGDLDDRNQWDDFTKAYRGLLLQTSTKWAPWYCRPGRRQIPSRLPRRAHDRRNHEAAQARVPGGGSVGAQFESRMTVIGHPERSEGSGPRWYDLAVVQIPRRYAPRDDNSLPPRGILK